MRLSITIKNAPQGCNEMLGKRFSFEDRGLTFGRGDANDLVLPDPDCFVSSRHGVIEFSNGQFTVQDLSANGLFLNQDSNPLGGGKRAVLDSGAQLKAGNYRLSIEISGDLKQEDEQSRASNAQPITEYSEEKPASSADTDVAEELAWRLGLHGMSETQLRSMPAEITTLVRRCVGSLIEVLSSRRQIKSQLKMDTTVIQRTDNNPLKVSANAEDALSRMFSESNDSYMEPEQALVEAFEDIGDHQVAMMSASLQAYQQVVDRFDPEAIEKNLSKRTDDGSVFAGKRKWWNEYKQQYESIAADGKENIREAFLRDFSDAYREHLLKLKKERNNNDH